jgi:hypothetical protein
MLQFDIGFGDVVWPEPVAIEFPTILEDFHPRVIVYPVEAIIAEKFEIMLKLEMLNSRLKDFYDIYNLSFGYNFKGEVLKKSIEKTLQRRQTVIKDMPIIFREEFKGDKTKQQQ